MKKIISLIVALAMLTCLFTVFVSADDLVPVRFSLDAIGVVNKVQTPNEANDYVTVSGDIEVGTAVDMLGWFVSSAGSLDKIQYSIDGGEWKDAQDNYRARADVGGVFPGYDTTKAGFGSDGAGNAMILPDTANLAVGKHTLKIRAHISDGSDVEFVTVDLNVLGEVEIPDPTEFTLDPNATQYIYGGNQGGAPYNFKSAQTSAIQFKIPDGKGARQFVYLAGPTWGNAAGTGSDCLFEIYKWNGDYESSVTGSPLDSCQVYGHKDCTDIIIQFSKTFGAGEYIIVNTANGGNSIGCWDAAAAEDTTTFFVNGAVSEGYIARFAAMLVDYSEPAPQTGDVTVAMFAVIAVVALAAVVVLKKRVND